MWNIKDIKKKGKKTLKNNFWTLLFVGLFMTLAIGEYAVTKDGLSNSKILQEFIDAKQKGENIKLYDHENKEVLVNKYIDELISQTLFGKKDTSVTNLNEKYNVTKGTFYVIFDTLMKQQIQFRNFVESVTNYVGEVQVAKFILVVTSVAGLCIKVFISNPIVAGESRIYLESINYKKTKFNRLLYVFNKKRYWPIVKSIFLLHLYQLLWNFTIVGGIIKSYSYKMVTYIVAENPNIKADEAIKMSKVMMDGNKLKTFWFDFSYMGWHILEFITLGLVGLYSNPYYKASLTELYKTLREEYINDKKYNYELLNDNILYEENDLEKYPSEEVIRKKKIKIDYNKNYTLTSLILFFFTFSIAGWLWEVCLYLFRDGILVNRGTLYGPWLPIYGWGCTIIILLTKFKPFRKMLKNPFVTFNIIMLLCSIIEYGTSWYIEKNLGLRYWDYTGIFMNLNGRICLECTLMFGIGGSICVYFVAPILENLFQKITKQTKIVVCMILTLLFGMDNVYAKFHPHQGEGITTITTIQSTSSGNFDKFKLFKK